MDARIKSGHDEPSGVIGNPQLFAPRIDRGPVARRVFGPSAAAGAAAYARTRDLPKLIALWPHELDDESPRVPAHLGEAAQRAQSRTPNAPYPAIGAMT
jgi:hypothetical protein